MERLSHPSSRQRAAHPAREAGAEGFPAMAELTGTAARPEVHESVLSAMYGHEARGTLTQPESGSATCDYQEELRQLSAQLLTIQESERQRIAADLHDGIGQTLSLIRLSLESALQQMNAGESKEAAQSLRLLTQKVKDAMDELHRTTMDMRPSMLDDLGIVPTLSWFLREFESAWHGRMIEKDVGIAESDVPLPLKTTIFRILQEAVNNIVKHADADRIRISLRRNGARLQLLIEDNGHGFDAARVSSRSCTGHGFGLLTMKERARSSGGTFEMESSPTQGTRIFISWQLVNGAAEAGAAQLPCERQLLNRSTR